MCDKKNYIHFSDFETVLYGLRAQFRFSRAVLGFKKFAACVA